VESITSITEILVQHDTSQLAVEQGIPQLFESALSKASLQDFVGVAKRLKVFSTIEVVRKTLLKHKFFSALYRHLESHLKPSSLPDLEPFRHLVQDKEILEQIQVENLSFFSSLTMSLDATNSPEPKVDIAGMVLVLFPPKRSSPLFQNIKKILVADLSASAPNLRNKILDCLIQGAALEEPRKALLAMGVKEKLSPLTSSEDVQVGLTCSLILALLAAGDENETGSEPTQPSVISAVVDRLLEDVSLQTIRSFETVPGYETHCRTLFISIRSMAVNEANMKALRESKVVEHLQLLFKFRTGDLLLADSSNLQEVRPSLVPFPPPSLPPFSYPFPFHYRPL